MAQTPLEHQLEQVLRAYGRAVRGAASLIPGGLGTQAVDTATETLRRALGADPGSEQVAPTPADSAASVMASPGSEADFETSATTVEFDPVPGRTHDSGAPDGAAADAPVSAAEAPVTATAQPAGASPFSYSIPRPGESGRKGTLFATYEDEIAAPIERCWDVAADVLSAPAWTPPLLEARVAPENTTDPPTIFDTVADASVKKTKAKLRFEFDRPRGMRWEQLEGDQKFLIGAWEFEQRPEGRVRALYMVEIDLGRALSMVVRGPVRDRVTDMLTRGSVEGLKKTAE